MTKDSYGSGDVEGALRRYFGARTVFILVTLLVTTPAPYASLWGGSVHGSPWMPLVGGVLWGATLILGRVASKRAGLASSSGQRFTGAFLCVDVGFMTALLAASGAAQNPFTLLYFVPITLATMVAQKWTFRVAGLSVVGFGLLLLLTALDLRGHANHPHHAHFFQHVRGMAVALAVAGAFVTYFVHRVARALARQAERISELSREQQENRFAIALGALSAGAAHELGSPLGTVQLLAEEIPHLSPDDQLATVGTIRLEIQRMKQIVHGMCSTELSAQVLGDGASWSFSELGAELEALSVPFLGNPTHQTTQPKTVIAQILRELVRNARRVASSEGLTAELASTEDEVMFSVHDDGPGLTPEQILRVREPFVSETGGTGLGLFLAHVHARQLGGNLTLEPHSPRGTSVSLRLPRNAPLARDLRESDL